MKKLKNALVFLFVAIAFLRVEEYIIQGKDSFRIDPNPNLLYTRRKFAKKGSSCAVVDSNSGEVLKLTNVSVPLQDFAAASLIKSCVPPL